MRVCEGKHVGEAARADDYGEGEVMRRTRERGRKKIEKMVER